MLIKVKTKWGNDDYVFEVDEKDEMESIHKAVVLANPRRKCNICGCTDKLYPRSNKDKEGNTYVNIVCGGCGAKSKLGQYKAGGYFWHDYKTWANKQDVLGSKPAGGDIDLSKIDIN